MNSFRNRKRHAEMSIKNPKTFTAAYEHIENNPDTHYKTAKQTEFTATAGIAKKGPHKGEEVIYFKNANTKKYPHPAYVCCWDKMTNCYRTYIGQYTSAIK